MDTTLRSKLTCTSHTHTLKSRHTDHGAHMHVNAQRSHEHTDVPHTHASDAPAAAPARPPGARASGGLVLVPPGRLELRLRVPSSASPWGRMKLLPPAPRRSGGQSSVHSAGPTGPQFLGEVQQDQAIRARGRVGTGSAEGSDHRGHHREGAGGGLLPGSRDSPGPASARGRWKLGVGKEAEKRHEQPPEWWELSASPPPQGSPTWDSLPSSPGVCPGSMSSSSPLPSGSIP